MKDDYRIGSELEWLKHSNDELANLVKKRQTQARAWRLFSMALLVLLAWVLYQFSKIKPLSDLF